MLVGSETNPADLDTERESKLDQLGDEVSYTSSGSQTSGLRKVTSAKAKEKARMVKHLPDQSEGFCFRVAGNVKWDLGKKMLITKDLDDITKL